MKNSTLIRNKYQQIRKWKQKIYDFFDEIDKNPNKEIDNINLMYLKDWFKSIKLIKIEIKNLKEELKNEK